MSPTKTVEPDLEAFMTTGEAAEMYGVSQHDVQKAIKKGYLKAQKVGYFYLLWKPGLPTRWPTSD